MAGPAYRRARGHEPLRRLRCERWSGISHAAEDAEVSAEDQLSAHSFSANPAPDAPLPTMARLRNATWSSHQRLEKRLDVKRRFSTHDQYRGYLEKMWGFCAPLEQQLERHPFGSVLADYESRRKLPLLTHDLIAMGATASSVASLPRCVAVADCADLAGAFGCAYVMEGATLGGRTLLPLVQSRLGVNAQHGAKFLASYGEGILGKWRTFGAALEVWCCTPERQKSAAWAAVATFETLEGWLCGAAA
jgi:heme oxygenase (biliverdin-IX-beta and delta-forming)